MKPRAKSLLTLVSTAFLGIFAMLALPTMAHAARDPTAGNKWHQRHMPPLHKPVQLANGYKRSFVISYVSQSGLKDHIMIHNKYLSLNNQI